MQLPPTHTGFPATVAPQPQQAGGEWMQAAQYVQMTGQLPPGMSPEDIQNALTSAQQNFSDAQDGQKQMAMQGIHQQAMHKMSLTNKMESGIENASASLQNMANSIGDIATAGKKKNDQSSNITDTTSQTPVTNNSDMQSLSEKTNPMNFSQNMQEHLQHIDAPLQNSNGFNQLLNGASTTQPQIGFGQAPNSAMQMQPSHHPSQMPSMHTTQGVPVTAQPVSPHLQGIPVGA